MSNLLLDNLFARRPKIHYVCPPICGLSFIPSSSGSASVSFDNGSPLPCVHYFLTVRGLEWSEYSEAVCYNVYQAVFGSSLYIPILECVERQIVPTSEGSCYIVTAVTANGESPFCIEATVCPGITPPVPTPPGPLPCVNYFLTNTTSFTSNFTWDAYPGATGYNVYMSEDATPTMFTLVHSNIPLSVLPIDCQRAVVTAITPAGESSTCAPIHFCNTNVGPCGSILIDPLSLGPVGWWKADSYLPLALGDNTPVGGPGLEWIDQSGNGRSGVTGSTKPNYRAVNTIFPGSGKPSLDFSVGNLDISGLTIGSGDFTFVFLYASTTGAPLNVFLGGVIGFPHNAPSLAYAVHGQYTVEDEATGAFHSPTDACANGGNFSGHPNIAIFRRSGNRLSFFNNSMNLGSIDCTSLFFSYQFTRLGQYTSAIGNHNLSGNFGEVMLFNKGISDADIVTLVEGYLRPRWCLTDCVA